MTNLASFERYSTDCARRSPSDVALHRALGNLAGRIWRFGIMGYSCKMENVMLCLCALETVFADMGVDVRFGAAESTAYPAYALNPSHARVTKKVAA